MKSKTYGYTITNNPDWERLQEANKRKLAYRSRIVIWVGLIALTLSMLTLFFFQVNKALIRKDCEFALYQSNEFPLYQPEPKLVESCSKIGIEFKP